MNEQTDSASSETSYNYRVDVAAKATLGYGSASVSGMVSGGTNSARQETAKNVQNAMQNHSSSASAKRDIEINTSYNVRTEVGVETSIEREIQNINVGRTLNFVFRQLNQEFISILHLVDTRIAFYNGNPYDTVEVTLPQMESFLNRFIINDTKLGKNNPFEIVKRKIIAELTTIFDYKSQVHSDFVTEEDFLRDKARIPDTGYLRVNYDKTSDYEIRKPRPSPIPEQSDPGWKVTVPGIILAENRYTLKTEGIVVDSVIGTGSALDPYSEKLQYEANRTKEIENNIKEIEHRKIELGINTIENQNNTRAEIFEKVFPCCKPTIFSLWPPKENKVEEQANV